MPDERQRLIGLAAWRRSGNVPTDRDHRFEDDFLEQHFTGGALIHLSTAKALARALEDATEPGVRSRLALRLFAEYVNSLETLGAWGWAIRNRGPRLLVVDAFLSYETHHVRDFYGSVSAHTGELRALLLLPPTQAITDAFRRRGVSHTEMLHDLMVLEKRLKRAAEVYAGWEDDLFVTFYNKAKHGAPIMLDPSLAEHEFWVVTPNRSSGPQRHAQSKFSSKPTRVSQVVDLVEHTSVTTQALIMFAANLKVAGLLYREEELDA